MKPVIDASAILHNLKREDPFRPFDIEQQNGTTLFVRDRWYFAFNDRYVLVTDDQDHRTRIQFENILKIEPRSISVDR